MKLSLILLVALAACGSSDGGHVISLDATRGDACTALGEALCNREVECGFILGSQVPICTAQRVSACCTGTECAQHSVTPELAQQLVDSCVAALDSANCQILWQGILPPACTPQ